MKILFGLLTILAIMIAAVALLWISIERSILPRKTTIAFWRLSDLPFIKKLEGYIYAARSSWYLKPASWPWFMRRYAGNESGDTYHGKVISQGDAAKMINLKQDICLTDLEHVVPYPVARDIILKQSVPSIAALDCPCRQQKSDYCRPLDVCLVIGEPFVSFAVEHQPGKARRIDAEEALRILDAEEKRGHVHTAWFKDAMHNRFYTICNCCSCCCLGMQSYFRGVPRLAHSGYRPEINTQDCVNCGSCVKICPFKALNENEELPVLNNALCMGCGLCSSHCAKQAISMVLAPERGIPLDIERLI
ncbi:MAG: 4Fe-4S binding protein [Syntrophomonas sp.]